MTHPIYSHDAWSDYRLRVETAGRQGLPPEDRSRVVVLAAKRSKWRQRLGTKSTQWGGITLSAIKPTDPCPNGSQEYSQASQTFVIVCGASCWLCRGSGRVVGDLQLGRATTEEEEEAQEVYRYEQWATRGSVAWVVADKGSTRSVTRDIATVSLKRGGVQTRRCSILSGQHHDDIARARRATITIDREVLFARLQRAFDATRWSDPTDATP